MQIIHVTKTIDPSAGGLPAVVVKLGISQSQLGHNVTFISCDQDPAETFSIYWKQYIQTDHTICMKSAGTCSQLKAVLKIKDSDLDDLLSSTNILHLHGVWDPIVKLSANWAKKHGVPYVVAPHGMLDTWSLSQKTLKKKLALMLGYRGMLENASSLHVLNVEEKNMVGELGIKCPMQILPNGIFKNEFHNLPPFEKIKKAFPALVGKRYILFLGRLHYKKGLDVLIMAYVHYVRQGGEMDLVISGPDDGMMSKLTRMIEGFSIKQRVHFTGPLYGEKKLLIFSAAYCFCLPSRQEGFSLAITEAMACGLPVIITEACHFNEVKSENAGFIVDRDADEIATVFKCLEGNKRLAEKMGNAGQNLVMKHYTWDKIAETSINIYKNLQKEPGVKS